VTDCITPEFAARFPDWCAIYAPLDVEHFAGAHREQPDPHCPKCPKQEAQLSLTI
jgi:hypothetical protein